MSFDCVVDASVGIKLFLVEPLSNRADALFAAVAGSPPARLYVPDLFCIECTSILWKYVRHFGYQPGSARQDGASLVQLPVQAVSTEALAEAALAVALDHGLTAYDAAYAALASGLSLPLVTADEALTCRLDGSGLDVRWLGEWPP